MDANALQGLPMGLAAVGLGAAALLYFRLRRQEAVLQTAKRRLGEVEYQLNEAELALQSESQILLTWSGASAMPERMVGTMHGAVPMPGSIEHIIDFASWLERDSALRLSDEMAALRASGAPFNFGVKTLQGDLLEADGRAAGTLSTLRFRPLAGQRLETSETLYDAHKLTRQVERLSAILDSAPFPIWLANREDKITWVNQAYVHAVEAGSGDAVLKGNQVLVKPEGIDRSKANEAQSIVGRARGVFHGGLRAFNIHQQAMDGGNVCFAIDVTPLEDAERELDRHIKAHASTLDKLSTAIAIFGPDQRLRFYNQAFMTLWQLDEKFLNDMPADGEILDRLRSQRVLPEQANYREWRAKQLQAYSKIEPREDYWYLPDGRSLRVIAEQHPFGGITYLYENLTKEYQLESRYNELFEVQRETLDNLAEAVALSGPDGRLRLYNPAFMRFWSVEAAFLDKKPHVNELAQLPALSIDSRAAWADIKFGVTGLEGDRKPHEGRITQDDRVLRYRAVPLPDGNALLTFTDVSDAVRAERALQDRAEALEAADRLKNSILANVSYEVRTPLNSIIGFSEALELGLMGTLSKKQAEYIGAIRRSSEDLKSIIDAIIDLSAIDAGQMELKLAQIDVASLLERTAEKFVLTLEKRQIDLSIEMASDVSTLVGDPNRLEQVLGNLLSNAIGFSPQGAKVRMGARRQGEMLQIWVADAGRGIDPEFQRKVFERFQSKPAPGSHRGPGLGLALVKSFTELHGGRVSLISKLEQGTTVVCTLPVAGPAKAARPALNSSAA
ncbi:MAG: PAS-domain containing protein [Alphaproteobacteria bacterium]|nr:PAS-domain containing protein [Alphaproteobacteria bacterium]